MINKQVFRLKKNGEPCKFCFCRYPEKIENYDKAISDTMQTWECHHRREELYSRKELIERGEYYDVQPEELIFLTPSEHNKIDSKRKRQSKTIEGKLINRKDLSKKILCVETKEMFDSTRDAERKTGIRHDCISQVCRGKRKSAGGYHWSFL